MSLKISNIIEEDCIRNVMLYDLLDMNVDDFNVFINKNIIHISQLERRIWNSLKNKLLIQTRAKLIEECIKPNDSNSIYDSCWGTDIMTIDHCWFVPFDNVYTFGLCDNCKSTIHNLKMELSNGLYQKDNDESS